ncbi:hypothetical protein FJZ28_05300 [Candidatus Peregrinibacteria bacterium]|nr:hypothetical protein [Candidatus Peregrinibacteria bacterium]
MRFRTSIISASVALTGVLLPAIALAAESQQYWPSWIGRVSYDLLIPASPARQMSQGPLYLPRSLVRTGAFKDLVEEVRKTPGSTTQTWPDWIDEIGQ